MIVFEIPRSRPSGTAQLWCDQSGALSPTGGEGWGVGASRFTGWAEVRFPQNDSHIETFNRSSRPEEAQKFRDELARVFHTRADAGNVAQTSKPALRVRSNLPPFVCEMCGLERDCNLFPDVCELLGFFSIW